jgi:aspartate aminotransferase
MSALLLSTVRSAALASPQDCIEEMVKAFSERRQYVLEQVRSLPRLNCPTPNGAFYVFIDISQTGLKSRDFCQKLLETQKVAAIPKYCFRC